MRRAAIVLCGGGSTRMGQDKAALPFGPGETLLSTVVRRAAETLDGGPVVCVAAANQALPKLPDGCQVVRDRTSNQGPLEALATGLQFLDGKADAVIALGCDAPLITRSLIDALFFKMQAEEPMGDSVVVPCVDGKHQPLLAVYEASLLAQAEQLLAAGKRSLHALLDVAKLCEMPEEDIRQIDPELHSFLNCNDDQSYQRALELVGLE